LTSPINVKNNNTNTFIKCKAISGTRNLLNPRNAGENAGNIHDANNAEESIIHTKIEKAIAYVRPLLLLAEIDLFNEL